MLDDWLINDIREGVLEWRDRVTASPSNIKFKNCPYNVTMCGCTESRYTYVRFCTRKLSYYPYKPGTIAISDLFTGCIFAIFQYEGEWYIAHLPNEDGENAKWTNIWISFCRANEIKFFTLFYPAGGNGEIVELGLQLKKPNVQAVGVIVVNETLDRPIHKCYSLVYENYEMNHEHLNQIQWTGLFTERMLLYNNISVIPKQNQQLLSEKISGRLKVLLTRLYNNPNTGDSNDRCIII